jgi:hypothetical protein
MHKFAAVLLSFVLSVSVFGQVDERDTVSPAPPPTAAPAHRDLRVVTSSASGAIPKYNSTGSLVDSALVENSGLNVYENMVLVGTNGVPRFYLQYLASPGYGADVTGLMGSAEMLSFGFNSEGTFAGMPANSTGRTLYFYDRIAAVYRGALDGTGTWTFGSAPTSYGLKVGAPAAGTKGLLIDSSGNVTIGTPTQVTGKKLYVNGDVQVDGSVIGTNIRAQYQDVAEWVPSAENLAPGTVVVVDKVTGNTVTASTTAYDTSVAGVVSEQPGIILGQASASKEQVATTGRVRVRVDATKSAIRLGDLLVTSDLPGTAMKSAPIDIGGVSIHRPGTIVGKALEPLDAGIGEILVLLSLQ